MLNQIVNYSAISDIIRNVKRNMPYVDLLGEGVVINGTYTSDKNVRIVGSVDGDIYVRGHLTIEESGKVNGNVFADNIDISGVVRGDLSSKNKITIRGSALISGDLYTKSLEIESDAVVKGGIYMTDDEKQQATDNVKKLAADNDTISGKGGISPPVRRNGNKAVTEVGMELTAEGDTSYKPAADDVKQPAAVGENLSGPTADIKQPKKKGVTLSDSGSVKQQGKENKIKPVKQPKNQKRKQIQS